MKLNMSLESIASLNISILKDYYLDTLLIGTNPITNGMNLCFIMVLFDDFVINFTKVNGYHTFFFDIVGILKMLVGIGCKLSKETFFGD